jgi:hypothetical protein
LNFQRLGFVSLLLLSGIALPLIGASSSPNQTTAMTTGEVSSQNLCNPIQTYTVGLTATNYACPATIRVTPVLPGLDWTGTILLMLLVGVGLVFLTVGVVVVYALARQ